MAHPTIALDLTVAALRVSPRNARKAGPGDLTDLAASIVSIGLIHPLKVLALAEPDGKITHEIVAGDVPENVEIGGSALPALSR